MSSLSGLEYKTKATAVVCGCRPEEIYLCHMLSKSSAGHLKAEIRRVGADKVGALVTDHAANMKRMRELLVLDPDFKYDMPPRFAIALPLLFRLHRVRCSIAINYGF